MPYRSAGGGSPLNFMKAQLCDVQKIAQKRRPVPQKRKVVRGCSGICGCVLAHPFPHAVARRQQEPSPRPDHAKIYAPSIRVGCREARRKSILTQGKVCQQLRSYLICVVNCSQGLHHAVSSAGLGTATGHKHETHRHKKKKKRCSVGA